MYKSSLRVLLVVAAGWVGALCLLVDPSLGLLTLGLFALAELTMAMGWIDPGPMVAVVPLGWALFAMAIGRIASPTATALFGSSGFLIHVLYAVLARKKSGGYNL